MYNKYADEITAALNSLRSKYEEGEAFVTDKISYLMRNLTKRSRKNYLGIYDVPTDSVTGDEKYWPPLTETFTDAVIKTIDIDTKDVSVYSVNGTSVGASRVMTHVLRAKLNEARFGESLNAFLRYLAIDGHGVLKFVRVKQDKKDMFRVMPVDMLNLYADQSADSLLESDGFMERSLMSVTAVKAKKGVWEGLDKVTDTTEITRYPTNVGSSRVKTTSPYVVMWDYWGKISKKWVTGSDADKDEWVEGHVIASGSGDNISVVHLVEEVANRPYDDVPLQKVIGRLQGRGVPEKLFGTQKNLNETVNMRKKNARILQQGLFRAKKSLNLTADSALSKVTAGGIIQVNESDDFTALPVQDMRESSYRDEDRLVGWGERVAGVPDIRRGELAASSAPATNTLMKDRNSKDLFELVQENVGLMLERFIEANVIPWIVDNVKDSEVVSVTGTLRELEDYDSAVAEHLVNQEFAKYVEAHGQYPDPREVEAAKEKQMAALRKMGTRRFLQVRKDSLKGDHGVIVRVTTNDIDTGLVLQKLQEMLALAANDATGKLNLDPAGIIDATLDLLDIPTDRVYSSRMPQKTPISAEAERLRKSEQAAAPAQAGNAVTGNVAPQPLSAAVPSGSRQAQVERAMPRGGGIV